MDTNETLTQAWKEAKQRETEAANERIAIESRIYELNQKELPEKGTFTLPTGMKIATGYAEEWDQEELNRCYQGWPEGIKFPFAGIWKPDGKAISYLRDNAPDTYRILQPALTLKPKKPSFTIK